MNDVIDFSRYYFGSDAPPSFHKELMDMRGKIFIPYDDYKMIQKLDIQHPENDVILHYYVHDSRQNVLLSKPKAHLLHHREVFAVMSPDFSVDSAHCYSCLNEGNILKSRIIAYIWQSELDLRVILTLAWGNEDTYRMAFSNIEKGSVVSVSHQGIADEQVFRNGICEAIDRIEPETICWYGNIPGYMAQYYDLNRIVSMQTRSKLVSAVQRRQEDVMSSQLCFGFLSTGVVH